MVMFVGLVGLLTVAFSLQSATVRLKETPVGLLTGLTPLINVELPHSRAELETLLGPPGSENRKIIANRLVFVGFDFVPGWRLFLFGLEILIHNFRPKMRRWEATMLAVMTATLVLEWFVVRQTSAAANAPVITDGMVQTIRNLAWAKWALLFFDTALISVLLYNTPSVLRLGGYMIGYPAMFGVFAASYWEWLIPPIVLLMFAGLCGVSVLFIVKPELVLTIPEEAKREEDSPAEEAPAATAFKMPLSWRVGNWIGPAAMVVVLLDQNFIHNGHVTWMAFGAMTGWFVWSGIDYFALKKHLPRDPEAESRPRWTEWLDDLWLVIIMGMFVVAFWYWQHPSSIPPQVQEWLLRGR
jgi:hypothetical protein